MKYRDIHDILKVSSIKERQLLLKKSKPYLFPKKYVSYDIFLGTVVAAETGVECKRTWDISSCHFYTQAAIWDKNNTPIYGLSEETLELFSNSTVDSNKDLFDGLQTTNQSVLYCILLPANTFTTTDGGYLEILWIESVHNNTEQVMSITSKINTGVYERQIKPGKRRVTSGGIDTNSCLWCVATEYPQADKTPIDIGSSPIDSIDREIIQRLRELTLQIVMAIEYLPQSISAPSPSIVKRGFSNTAKIETTWHIRTVHVEQKQYTSPNRAPSSSLESRQSPRPHWRRYHWRKVATGKGRIDREWRLIQTVYVNK